MSEAENTDMPVLERQCRELTEGWRKATRWWERVRSSKMLELVDLECELVLAPPFMEEDLVPGRGVPGSEVPLTQSLMFRLALMFFSVLKLSLF